MRGRCSINAHTVALSAVQVPRCKLLIAVEQIFFEKTEIKALQRLRSVLTVLYSAPKRQGRFDSSEPARIRGANAHRRTLSTRGGENN